MSKLRIISITLFLLLFLTVCAKGAALSGRVTDGSSGIFNVLVQIWQPDSDPALWYTSSSDDVYTDSNGNYTISDLATNIYRIEFTAPYSNYLSEWYNDKADLISADVISIPASGNLTLNDTNLTPGGSISGRVTDGMSSYAWVSVMIYNIDDEDNFFHVTFTDTNGDFSAIGLPSGEYKLFYLRDGNEKWFNDKNNFSSADQITVTQPSDTDIGTIILGVPRQKITIEATPANAGAVYCNPNPIEPGLASTCNIDPNDNYSIGTVSGTCGGMLNEEIYMTNEITEDCTLTVEFALMGDINNTGSVDFLDTIMSLQVAAGIVQTDAVNAGADVNRDGMIGTEEAVFSLREAAGL